MAQVNAGRVRFVSRGEYNNATQYYTFDLVNYNGSSYYAKENTLGNLPTDSTKWQLVAEKGNKGDIGPIGVGVQNITKTSTSGLVDTYTITYTNGSTTTFNVNNGKGIVNITKVLSQDNIDTYRITYNDGTTFDYEIENGTVTQTQFDDLQDRVEDLERNQKTGEASGTEIDLTDAFDTRPRYLGIDATETTQETTTGKNKVNTLTTIRSYPSNKAGNPSTARTFTLDTYILGIASNNYYGNAITLNSHSKDSWNFTSSSAGFGIAFPLNLETGNYVLSLIRNNCTPYILKYDSSGNYISNSTILNITIEENYNYLLVIIAPNTNTEATFSNVMIRPSSITDDTYEPYTGGNPSPSPEFLQDVETMVGYRNLWNDNRFPNVTTNGITLSHNSKGEILLNGTATAQADFNAYYFDIPNEMTQITLSGGSSSASISFQTFTSDGTYISAIRDSGSNATYTIPNNASKYALNIRIPSGTVLNNYVVHAQLLLGTEEKPYVSYGTNYMLLDDVGKNLLQFENKDFTVVGVRCFTNNGNLYFNGTSNAEAGTSNSIWKNNLSFYLDAGTYTLSNNNALFANAIRKYGDDSLLVSINSQTTNASFTLTERTQVYLGFYIYQQIFNNKLMTIQLEQGSAATPYEPYKGKKHPISLANQELLNKSNYVDKIIVDESTGQSYIEKVWGKVVLDGSENWKSNWQHQEEYIQFYLSKTDFSDNYNVSTLDNTICTHLLPNATSIWNAARTCYAISDNITYSLQIKFDKNIISSLDNFILFLQTQYNNGTPVTIYYSLATPQLITIDNPKIKLLNGVNHITNSEGAEMDIVYVKDINAYLDSINARLEALENANN